MGKSLKARVREYGGRPKRSLGQVFLIERAVQRKILEDADLTPDDVVVEIGPGTGTLTRDLAGQVRRLIALEVDQALALYLRDSLGDLRNVHLICADALEFDYARVAERLGVRLKVVGNLPYVISTPLLFTFAACRASLSLLTLMVQKEVAERLTARPNTRAYGALTVLTSRSFEIRIRRKVSRHCFSPVPRVDSAVIGCTPRDSGFADAAEETLFVQVVKSAFSKRRKTLFNALRLSGPFGGEKDALAEALEACRLEPSRRPETLAPEEFLDLTRSLRTIVTLR
jgi:16S rRNA (adenine1518-N6/adenine1519-N6)-dimethyltransferase